MSPEKMRETRRMMIDALFSAMGEEYVPVALVGLHLVGTASDPNAYRTLTPEAFRPFLAHGGAEAAIAQFSYTLREFSKHPEDVGAIDPNAKREPGGAHELQAGD